MGTADPKLLEMELLAPRLEILAPEVSEGPSTQKGESRQPWAADGGWGVAALHTGFLFQVRKTFWN